MSTPISRELVLAGALSAALLVILPNGTVASSAIVAERGTTDPDAILDARSPGARPQGALFQTKPGRPLAQTRARPGTPARPEQRVLSTVRDRPMVIPVNDTAPILSVPSFDPIPVDAFARNPGSFVDPLGTLPFALPVSSVPGRPITNPAGAVPEPSAWLMLISGHAVLGWSLRRRRRIVRLAP